MASHCLSIGLEPGESRDLVFTLGYVEMPDECKFEKQLDSEALDGLKNKVEGTPFAGPVLNSCSDLINKSAAYDILSAFNTSEQVEKAFVQLKDYWDNLLGRFHVESKVPELDRMVNVWNQYQCMVTFNMSRSASFLKAG